VPAVELASMRQQPALELKTVCALPVPAVELTNMRQQPALQLKTVCALPVPAVELASMRQQPALPLKTACALPVPPVELTNMRQQPAQAHRTACAVLVTRHVESAKPRALRAQLLQTAYVQLALANPTIACTQLPEAAHILAIQDSH